MNKIRLRQILIAAAIMLTLLLVVSVGLFVSERKAQRSGTAPRTEVKRDFRSLGQDIDPAAIWIERSEAQFETLQRNDKALMSELERLTTRIEQFEQRHAQRNPVPTPFPETPAAVAEADLILEPPPLPYPRAEPPPSALLPAVEFSPPAALTAAGPDTGSNIGPGPAAATDTLAVEVRPPAPTTAPGPSSTGLHLEEYIPSGAFAQGVLLTGLDAPTGGLAQTNPVPVLLSLSSQGRLPNRFQHRIRECFITAAGYGDLASERVYLRLERLSCVLRSGQTLDLDLQGYVAGEDGKAGLRGKVVSKQGSLIGRSLLAGLAGGIGEGLSQSFTSLSTNALGSVQTIDGNQLLQHGLARGAGNALEQVAQWYLARADEIYPIVEISAGRIVEAVLTQGVRLHANLFESAEDGPEQPW